MGDWNGKFKGQEIDDAIEKALKTNASFVEADSVVDEPEPPAYKIYTDSVAEGKVDKVEGKGLSTEDFTTVLKDKLNSLSNYNDTAINNAINALQQSLNTLLNGNPNDAINSFNEIIAFLDGVKDNQDLSGIIASIEQQIAGKLDKTVAVETYLSKTDASSTYQPKGSYQAAGDYATKTEMNNAIASAISSAITTALNTEV